LREVGGNAHAIPLAVNGRRFARRGVPFGLFERSGEPHPLLQANAYAMIGRRAAAAGIATKLGNHSFRPTGITAYFENGGALEKAAAMATRHGQRSFTIAVATR